MAFFDEFLKTNVAAEDRAILDKYPNLRASVDQMETHLAQANEYASTWNTWAQTNYLADEGMTKAEKTLRAQLDEAKANLSTATASGASATTVDALRKELDTKLAGVQSESQKQIQGVHLFYNAAAKRMLPHQAEFGKNFDPNSLFEFMSKNGINDPDVAYDRMVAADRATISTQRAKELDEKHAADITAAEQRGREAAAREAAMGPHGMIPTDHSGGIAGVTAMVNSKPAQVSDEMKSRISEAKLGDSSLATLGYQQFLRGDLPVQ